MKTKFLAAAMAFGLSTVGWNLSANAAQILFVSDSTTDTSIATVLTGDGHTVSSFTGQYNSSTLETGQLTGSLAGYDAVYWSATGTGFGSLNSNAAMLSNLTNYVTTGGRIFVTGYDSISSPTDPSLMNFLGGTTNVDTCGDPGTVSLSANSLTTGVTDITGQTQSPPETGNQTCDRDGMGGLLPGTVGVVADLGAPGFYQWTLRTVGLGEIAYVSNGNHSSIGESSMWSDTSTIYNAAVRNFAANSATTVVEPGTLAILGLGLAGLGYARRKRAA